MDNQIHQIPKLIFKKFNQTISSAEEKELNEWIHASQSNEKLYHQIIDDENLTASLKRYFDYDVERAWAKVKTQAESAKRNKPIVLQLLKFAAVILPLLAASFFIVNEFSTPENEDLFAMESTTFEPGSKKAVLKTAHGKEVELGQNGALQKIKVDPIHTAIDSGFTLAYNVPSALEEKAVENTLVVPKGGEYEVVLSDGTRVWLNSATKITFPVQFNGDTRTVKLEGEAYFEVMHDAEKPFVVQCSSYAIQVLGTAFNVMNYNNEQRATTTLVNGKVQITDNARKKKIVLNPSEQATLSYVSGAYAIEKVNVKHYTAWKDGLFSFRSASLVEIMRQLSRWYNCDFQFEEPSLQNLHFTGTLDKYQNLKDLLLLISETCSVNFSVNNENTIIISLKQTK